MTDREAMKLALEALDSDNPDIQLRAAIALRDRLAAPEPEPVAVFDGHLGHPVMLPGAPILGYEQPLYAAPPDAEVEALRREDV